MYIIRNPDKNAQAYMRASAILETEDPFIILKACLNGKRYIELARAGGFGKVSCLRAGTYALSLIETTPCGVCGTLESK